MLSAQAMNMNCLLLLLLLLYHRGSTLNSSHYSMCEQIYAIWFGRHTAFINEPCAIRKPDCIFLFTHTVVRSIECATSMI